MALERPGRAGRSAPIRRAGGALGGPRAVGLLAPHWAAGAAPHPGA
jgi:hypothetical protein